MFLVRKAPVSATFISKHNIAIAEKKLSDDNREPEVDLITHKYVYRTLRVGYVYILVKHKQKGWEFMGYEVTPSGVFRHKSITDVKERNVKEIPTGCTKDGNNHHIPGSFINIDTSVYEGEAYIAYTRRAWSQGINSTIEKYLKLMNESSITIDLPSKKEQDSSESQDQAAQVVERNTKTIDLDTALKRFSKINLNEESYKDPDKLTEGGKRSFRFSSLESANSLLELAVDPKMIVHNENNDENNQKELISDENTFITAHKFNSLRDRKGYGVEYEYEAESRKLKDQIKKFQQSGKYVVPVVIVEDPFGIAEELSLQRQLKIEPIAQSVVKAEEIYNKKIDEHFRKLFESNKRLDETLKESLDENIEKSEEKTSDIEEYKPAYHAVVKTSVAKSKYFSEERLHLRKTLSLINDYRNQIESIEISQAKDMIYYDYISIGKAGPREITQVWPNSKKYLNEGLIEIPLSEEEKRKQLEKKQKGQNSDLIYKDVRAFRCDNTILQATKEKIAKERAKYDNLLDLEKERKFLEEDKEDYNAILDSISNFSQDYFYYLTWLFGFESCSEYAPKSINKFNDCEFWLIECDTNASNNHVGYLTDFLALIDFAYLGGIKTEEQTAVWDSLLNNKNSLLYHIIDGKKGSFWELVLHKRLKIMEDELSTISEFQPQLMHETNNEEIKKHLQQQEENQLKAEQERQQQTKIILQELEAEQPQNQLDGSFFSEKGQLMLTLYSMLLTRVSSGITNRPTEKAETQKDSLIKQNAKKLMIESGLIVTGELILYLQLQNIPALELNSIQTYFEPLSHSATPLPTFDYTVSDSSQQAETDWDAVDRTLNYIDMANKIVEVANAPKILASGRTFYRAVCHYILRDPSVMKFPVKDLKKIFIQSYNNIKKMNGESILNSVKNAGLNPTTKVNAINLSLASSQLLTAGLQAGVTYIQYQENLKKLEDNSIGETIRYEIKRDVQFGFYKVVAGFTNTINELLKFADLTLSQAVRTFITNRASLSTLVNGVFKISAGAVGVMGIISSVISITEGCFLFAKGMQKSGAVGTALCIAGGLQVISGIASLAQSIGLMLSISIFSGPIGFAIFVFILVAQLVITLIQKIFKDESDDWDKMQIWFNNCLFGTKSSDKGIAYVATFDSIALEINDFMAALINLDAVIQLQEQPIYYLEQMRTYKNSKKDYDQIGHPERTADVAHLCREIYISFVLPNYIAKQSYFEAILRFFDRNNKETVALKITKGDSFPILEFINGSPEDLLIKRQEPLKPIDNINHLIPSKVGQIESYKKATDSKNNELNYFQVFYKVGEFCYVGIEEIYLQLNYWPKGQTSQNSQNKIVDNQPLMIYYTYKHHHSAMGGF
ncbi:toxin VasX [Gilliamella apicola]|uniref:toxin VasX n=3 Tax=Gilliamella apicola TaxID=1196095 RepID=UPI0034607474